MTALFEVARASILLLTPQFSGVHAPFLIDGQSAAHAEQVTHAASAPGTAVTPAGRSSMNAKY